MRFLPVLIGLVLGGCGGGGGGGATASPAAPAVPTVDAGADQSITSTTSTLAGSSDADGVEWTQIAGPAPAAMTNPRSLTSAIRFPLVGTYRLRLTGWRGTAMGSDSVDVTVTGAGTILTGSVADDAQPAATTVDLRWADGTAILHVDTADDGSFTLLGLAGDVAEYRVVVRGSP